MKKLQWSAHQRMIIWLYFTIICTSYINCLEDSSADQRNESDDLSNDEKSSGYKVITKRSPLIGDANTSIKTRKKITIIKKKKKVCCITTNEVKKCSEELCKDFSTSKINSKEFIVKEVDDFEKKVICFYAVHGDYPKNIVVADWYKYDKSTYWTMPDSELEHICKASIFYRPGIITFAQEKVAICHFAEHGSYPIRYKDTTYWNSFDFCKLWQYDDNYLKRLCNIKIIIRPVVQGLFKSSEFYLFQKYLLEKYMKAKKNQNLTHACCLKSDFDDADEDNEASFDFMHSDLKYRNPESKKIEVNIFYKNIDDEGKMKWQGRKNSRGRVTEEQIEEMEESKIIVKEITLEYRNLLLYTIKEKKLEADVICYFRRNGKYPKLYLPISDDLNNSKLWIKNTKELDKMCAGKQIHRPTSGGEEREELDFIISNEIELQSICHFAKTGKYLTTDNNPSPEIVRSQFWLRSDPWFKLTCGYQRDHPYRPVEFWFGEEMEFSYGEKPDLPQNLLRNSKKINKYWVVNELDWEELEYYIYFGGFLKEKNMPKRASRILIYSEFSNFELFLLKLNSNGFSEGENDQPCCVKRMCAKEVPRIRGQKNTEERVSHNENKINIYQTNIYENQIRRRVKKPQQIRTVEDEEEIEIYETEEYEINKYKKPKSFERINNIKRVLKKPVIVEKIQNLRKHKKKDKSETIEEENDLNEINMRRKSIKILKETKENDMHEMENKVLENIDTAKKSSAKLNDERHLTKDTLIRNNVKEDDDKDNVRVKVTKIRKQFKLDTEYEPDIEEGENDEDDIIKKRVKVPAKNAKLGNLALSTIKATKNKITKNMKKILVDTPDQIIENTDMNKAHTLSKVNEAISSSVLSSTEGTNSQSKFVIETESRRPLVPELQSVYTYKPIPEVISDQKQHIPESGSPVKPSAQPSENNMKEKPGALVEVVALSETNGQSKTETPSPLVKESISKSDNSEVKKNDVFTKKSVKINKQISKTITNPKANEILFQSKPKPESVTNLISPSGALEILEENHANSDILKPAIDTTPVSSSENLSPEEDSREKNTKNHTTGVLSAEKHSIESNAILSPLLSTISKLKNQESAGKNATQGPPGESFENESSSRLPSENFTKVEPTELSKKVEVPLSKHANDNLSSVLQPQILESKKLDSVNENSVSTFKGKHAQLVPTAPFATGETISLMKTKENPIYLPEDKLISNSKAPVAPSLTLTSVTQHIPNADTKQLSLLGGQQSVPMPENKSPSIKVVSTKPSIDDHNELFEKFVIQKNKQINLVIAPQKSYLDSSESNPPKTKIQPLGVPKENTISPPETKLISNSKAPLVPNLISTSVPQHILNEDTKQKMSLLGGQQAIEFPGDISHPINIISTKPDTDSQQTSNKHIRVSVSAHSKIGPTDSKRSRTKVVLQKNKMDNLVIDSQKNILPSSELNLPKIISSGVPRENPVSSPEDKLISNSKVPLVQNLISTSVPQHILNEDTKQKITLLGGHQTVQILGDKLPLINIISTKPDIRDHNEPLENVNKPLDLGFNSGSNTKQPSNKDIKVSISGHSKIGPTDSKRSRTKVVFQKNKMDNLVIASQKNISSSSKSNLPKEIPVSSPEDKLISDSKEPLVPNLASTSVPQNDEITKQKISPPINVVSIKPDTGDHKEPLEKVNKPPDLGLNSASNKHIKVAVSEHSKIDPSDSKSSRTKVIIQKNKSSNLITAPHKNILDSSESDLPKQKILPLGFPKENPISPPEYKLLSNTKVPIVPDLISTSVLQQAPNEDSYRKISPLGDQQSVQIPGDKSPSINVISTKPNARDHNELLEKINKPHDLGLNSGSNVKQPSSKNIKVSVSGQLKIGPTDSKSSRTKIVIQKNKPSRLVIAPQKNMLSSSESNLLPIENIPNKNSAPDLPISTGEHSIQNMEIIKDSVTKIEKAVPIAMLPIDSPPIKIDKIEVNSKLPPVAKLSLIGSSKHIPKSDSTLILSKLDGNKEIDLLKNIRKAVDISSSNPTKQHVSILDSGQKLPIHGSQQEHNSLVQELVSTYSTKEIPGDNEKSLLNGQPIGKQDTEISSIESSFKKETKNKDSLVLDNNFSARNLSNEKTDFLIPENKSISSLGKSDDKQIDNLEANQQESFIKELVTSYSTKKIKPSISEEIIASTTSKEATIETNPLEDILDSKSKNLQDKGQDSFVKKLVSTYNMKELNTSSMVEADLPSPSETGLIEPNTAQTIDKNSIKPVNVTDQIVPVSGSGTENIMVDAQDSILNKPGEVKPSKTHINSGILPNGTFSPTNIEDLESKQQDSFVKELVSSYSTKHITSNTSTEESSSLPVQVREDKPEVKTLPTPDINLYPDKPINIAKAILPDHNRLNSAELEAMERDSIIKDLVSSYSTKYVKTNPSLEDTTFTTSSTTKISSNLPQYPVESQTTQKHIFVKDAVQELGTPNFVSSTNILSPEKPRNENIKPVEYPKPVDVKKPKKNIIISVKKNGPQNVHVKVTKTKQKSRSNKNEVQQSGKEVDSKKGQLNENLSEFELNQKFEPSTKKVSVSVSQTTNNGPVFTNSNSKVIIQKQKHKNHDVNQHEPKFLNVESVLPVQKLIMNQNNEQDGDVKKLMNSYSTKQIKINHSAEEKQPTSNVEHIVAQQQDLFVKELVTSYSTKKMGPSSPEENLSPATPQQTILEIRPAEELSDTKLKNLESKEQDLFVKELVSAHSTKNIKTNSPGEGELSPPKVQNLINTDNTQTADAFSIKPLNMAEQILPSSGNPISNIENLEVQGQEAVVKELVTSYSTKDIGRTALPVEVVPPTKRINTNIEDMEAKQKDSFVQELVSSYSTKYVKSNTSMEEGLSLPDQVKEPENDKQASLSNFSKVNMTAQLLPASGIPTTNIENLEVDSQDSAVKELVTSNSTKGVDTTALPGGVLPSTKPTNSSILPNRTISSTNIEDMEAKQQDSFVQKLVSSYSTKHIESNTTMENGLSLPDQAEESKAINIAEAILPDHNRQNSAELEAMERDSLIKDLVSSYSTKYVKINPSLDDTTFTTSSTTKISSNLPQYPVKSQTTQKNIFVKGAVQELGTPNLVSSTNILSPEKPRNENMKPVGYPKPVEVKKPKKNIIISVKKNGPQNVHVKVTKTKQKSRSNKNEVQESGKEVDSKKGQLNENEPTFLNVESVLPVQNPIINQKNEQDADVNKLMTPYSTKQIKNNHSAEEKPLISNVQHIEAQQQDSFVKELVTSYSTKKIGHSSPGENMSMAKPQQTILETGPPQAHASSIKPLNITAQILPSSGNPISNIENLEVEAQDAIVKELVKSYSTKGVDTTVSPEEVISSTKPTNSSILPNTTICSTNVEDMEAKQQDSFVQELVSSYSTKHIESNTTMKEGLSLPDKVEETKSVDTTALPGGVIPSTKPTNSSILPNRTISSTNIENMEAKQQDSFVQELVSSYSTKHIESNTTMEKGLSQPDQVEVTKSVDTTALPGGVIPSTKPTNSSNLLNTTISSTNVEDMEAKQQDSFVQELVSSYSTKHIESNTTMKEGLSQPDQVEVTKSVDTTALPGGVIPSTKPTNSSNLLNTTISSTNVEDMEAKQQDSFVQELVSSYSTKHIESNTTMKEGLSLPGKVEETKSFDTTALPGGVIPSTKPTNASILPNRTISSTNIEDMEAKQQDSFVQELVSSYSTKHIVSNTTMEKGLSRPDHVEETKSVDTTALSGGVIPSTKPTNSSILPNRTISSTNLEDMEAKQQDSFVQELVSSYSTKHIESNTNKEKGLPRPDQVEVTKSVHTTPLPGGVIPSTKPTNSSILPNGTIFSTNIEGMEVKQQDSFVQELVSSYSTKHIVSNTTMEKGLSRPDYVEETKSVDTTAFPGGVIPSTKPTNSSILPNRTISFTNLEDMEAKQQDSFVQELVSSYSTKHIESNTTMKEGLSLPDKLEETKSFDTTALPGGVIPSTNPTNSSILPNSTISSTNIEYMEAKQQDSFVQELVSSYSTKHIESNTTMEKGLSLPDKVEETKSVDTTALPGGVIPSTKPTNSSILPNRTISSTNIEDMEAKQQDSFVQELVSSYSTKHIESNTTMEKGLSLPDKVEETKSVDTTALPGGVIPSTKPTNLSILPNRTISSTNIEDTEAKKQDSFVQELVEETKTDKPPSKSYPSKVENMEATQQDLFVKEIEATNNRKRIESLSPTDNTLTLVQITNTSEAILPDLKNTNVEASEANVQDSIVKELVSSYSSKYVKTNSSMEEVILPASNITQNTSDLPKPIIENQESSENKQKDIFVSELVSSYSNKENIETMSKIPLVPELPNDILKQNWEHNLSILGSQQAVNLQESNSVQDLNSTNLETLEAKEQDSIVKDLVSSYSSKYGNTNSSMEEVISPISNTTQNTSDFDKTTHENQEASEANLQDIFIRELVTSYSNKDNIETMANIPVVPELPNDISRNNSEYNLSILGSQHAINLPESNNSVLESNSTNVETHEAKEQYSETLETRPSEEFIGSNSNELGAKKQHSSVNELISTNSTKDTKTNSSAEQAFPPPIDTTSIKPSQVTSEILPVSGNPTTNIEIESQDSVVKELVTSYGTKVVNTTSLPGEVISATNPINSSIPSNKTFTSPNMEDLEAKQQDSFVQELVSSYSTKHVRSNTSMKEGLSLPDQVKEAKSEVEASPRNNTITPQKIINTTETMLPKLNNLNVEALEAKVQDSFVEELVSSYSSKYVKTNSSMEEVLPPVSNKTQNSSDFPKSLIENQEAVEAKQQDIIVKDLVSSYTNKDNIETITNIPLIPELPNGITKEDSEHKMSILGGQQAINLPETNTVQGLGIPNNVPSTPTLSPHEPQQLNKDNIKPVANSKFITQNESQNNKKGPLNDDSSQFELKQRFEPSTRKLSVSVSQTTDDDAVLKNTKTKIVIEKPKSKNQDTKQHKPIFSKNELENNQPIEILPRKVPPAGPSSYSTKNQKLNNNELESSLLTENIPMTPTPIIQNDASNSVPATNLQPASLPYSGLSTNTGNTQNKSIDQNYSTGQQPIQFPDSVKDSIEQQEDSSKPPETHKSSLSESKIPTVLKLDTIGNENSILNPNSVKKMSILGGQQLIALPEQYPKPEIINIGDKGQGTPAKSPNEMSENSSSQNSFNLKNEESVNEILSTHNLPNLRTETEVDATASNAASLSKTNGHIEINRINKNGTDDTEEKPKLELQQTKQPVTKEDNLKEESTNLQMAPAQNMGTEIGPMTPNKETQSPIIPIINKTEVTDILPNSEIANSNTETEVSQKESVQHISVLGAEQSMPNDVVPSLVDKDLLSVKPLDSKGEKIYPEENITPNIEKLENKEQDTVLQEFVSSNSTKQIKFDEVFPLPTETNFIKPNSIPATDTTLIKPLKETENLPENITPPLDNGLKSTENRENLKESDIKNISVLGDQNTINLPKVNAELPVASSFQNQNKENPVDDKKNIQSLTITNGESIREPGLIQQPSSVIDLISPSRPLDNIRNIDSNQMIPVTNNNPNPMNLEILNKPGPAVPDYKELLDSIQKSCNCDMDLLENKLKLYTEDLVRQELRKFSYDIMEYVKKEIDHKFEECQNTKKNVPCEQDNPFFY